MKKSVQEFEAQRKLQIKADLFDVINEITAAEYDLDELRTRVINPLEHESGAGVHKKEGTLYEVRRSDFTGGRNIEVNNITIYNQQDILSISKLFAKADDRMQFSASNLFVSLEKIGSFVEQKHGIISQSEKDAIQFMFNIFWRQFDALSTNSVVGIMHKMTLCRYIPDKHWIEQCIDKLDRITKSLNATQVSIVMLATAKCGYNFETRQPFYKQLQSKIFTDSFSYYTTSQLIEILWASNGNSYIFA